VHTANRLYQVQIVYREPLYEVWSGSGERHPFVARYHGIQADSRQEAEQIARSRFDFVTGESRVRWQREVLEIKVDPVG